MASLGRSSELVETHVVAGRGGVGERTLAIRTCFGGTAGQVWTSSRVLGALLGPTVRADAQVVLELGSGTGLLAMTLASGGLKGTRIYATEQAHTMKNLKFNVGRNQLRHAVRRHMRTGTSLDARPNTKPAHWHESAGTARHLVQSR